MTSQMLALALMAISWALRKGCMEQREAREQIAILRDLPSPA